MQGGRSQNTGSGWEKMSLQCDTEFKNHAILVVVLFDYIEKARDMNNNNN